MQKLPVKINELSLLILPFIEKIQMLDSNFLPKTQKVDITKEMSETVEKLREFFANASNSEELSESLKLFNKKIERAFSQYEWDSNIASSTTEIKKFYESGKSLVSSLLKHIGKKGCGVLIIETYVKLCMKVVKDMLEAKNTIVPSDKTDFRLLLDSFLMTANMCHKYWHIAFLDNQKNKIMLCFLQICKGLPFLLKMIEAHNNEIKKYTLKLINQCLNKILEEIHSDGNLQAKGCGQEFIILMDFCLYKLTEISNCTNDFPSYIQKSNEIVASLKPVIDELLCYGLSIAQVTGVESDHLAIVSGSEKVLREFGDLKKEIKEENICQIKLNATSLGEALCSLERRVNNAVLKLVLQVFSGVYCPLKNIVNKCRTDISKSNKASEDLNLLISEFDLEMDKIMQIGLFTISCTSNLNKILRIQSCLASLESLETELIPSLTALYLDSNAINKSNFQYLIDYWLTEITELKSLIDSVIDPAGFCMVVQSQIKQLCSDFTNDFHSSNLSQNKAGCILKQIIRYSRKLIRTLRTGAEDDKINEKTEECLNDFQLITQECEAVLELLYKEEDTNRNLSRAMKRCNLLQSTIDKLSSLYLDSVINEKSENKEDSKTFGDMTPPNIQIPQQNYYKLCHSNENVSTPSNLDILTPYINKGILLSKRRNILYTTPAKEEGRGDDVFDHSILHTINWDKTPVSRKRSRCCKPLNLNLELGNTIDLEITTVLENISGLSSTFYKSLNETSKKERKEKTEEPIKKGKDVACGMEKESEYDKPRYKSSGCCANLDSEEKEKSDLVKDETNKEEKEEEEEEEEEEEKSLGDKLRNKYMQSLNDLSLNASLCASEDIKYNEGSSEFDTPDRINDLKIVEEKINFLKQQIPNILP